MNELLLKFIEIAVLSVAGLYIQSRPKSIFARLALLKIPFIPSPAPNESESDYLKRYGRWTFMWFIRVLLIYVAVWYLFGSVMDSNMAVGITLRFALPLLAFICLARSAIWYVKALFCKARNIRKVFRNSEGRFIIDEIRDTYRQDAGNVV